MKYSLLIILLAAVTLLGRAAKRTEAERKPLPSPGTLPTLSSTGEAKTLHKGKIIASFVLGSKKTFDFLDNNPFVEFHPTEYG